MLASTCVGSHKRSRPGATNCVDGDKVDCHWTQYGLTVELITFRYHATRHGFENDNARRRRSRHIAYTYGDVVDDGAATAADVRERLEGAAGAR